MFVYRMKNQIRFLKRRKALTMIKINICFNFFGEKVKNTQHYIFLIFALGMKKKKEEERSKSEFTYNNLLLLRD